MYLLKHAQHQRLPWLLAAAALTVSLLAYGSSAPAETSQAAAAPKNLKVLPKNISTDELYRIMAGMQKDLGVQCAFCHEEDSETRQVNYASDENPRKETARLMMRMTGDINEKYLGQLGDRQCAAPITCGNCHLGQMHPPPYEGSTSRQTMKRLIILLPLAVACGAQAQRPGTTQWTATRVETAGTRQGAPLVIALDAKVEQGWHVYALKQAPGGPTPLSVRIEPDAPFELVGAIGGTAPATHHDASFNLDTESYTDAFQLRLSVVAKAQADKVPIAVRYQMCSETTCMPPKTVHLIAALN